MMVVEGAGVYANVVLLLRAPYGEATLNRSANDCHDEKLL
jgi:hypothetical protein